MRRFRKQLYLVWLIIFLMGYPASLATADTLSNFANCRLGVGNSTSSVAGYDIGQLNMGLYVDWTTRLTWPTGLPANVQYFQVIRVHQNKVGGWDSAYASPPAYTVTPNLTSLVSRIQANPGAVWFIGNEVDRRDWNGGGQDEIIPELYATAFHEVRDVIKATDPMAKIGIGSLVEATPLRLKYLDRLWSAYADQYGYSMGQDIDVWNIHGFILREEKGNFGAEIPAGLNDVGGFLAGASDREVALAHRNINYFKEFTEALRNWMAAHGERNKPLFNTEYGILFQQIKEAHVNQYLIDSLDYMLTKTDSTTGYPADENRLVQGWVWYSLNDNTLNGYLFDPTTQALTSAGTTWKNYVTNPANPLASQPQQNLLALNLRATPDPAYTPPGELATITLKVDVANSGNTRTATGNNIVVKFWDGVPNAPGSQKIGSTQILKDIPGCGGFATAQVTWKKGIGNHTWYVQIEPLTDETNTSDNTGSNTVSVVQGTPVADLDLAKTVNDNTPYTDQIVNYRLTLANNGPNFAYDVVVTDVLPAGVSFDSASTGVGAYDNSSGEWSLDSIAPGSEAVLIIKAKVEEGQIGNTITNSAGVTSTSTDPTPNNNDASIDINPIAGSPAFGSTYLPIIRKNSR